MKIYKESKINIELTLTEASYIQSVIEVALKEAKPFEGAYKKNIDTFKDRLDWALLGVNDLEAV